MRSPAHWQRRCAYDTEQFYGRNCMDRPRFTRILGRHAHLIRSILIKSDSKITGSSQYYLYICVATAYHVGTNWTLTAHTKFFVLGILIVLFLKLQDNYWYVFFLLLCTCIYMYMYVCFAFYINKYMYM